MKQIIILFAMIIVGIYTYGLLMGEDEGSVLSNVKKVWEKQIEQQRMYP